MIKEFEVDEFYMHEYQTDVCIKVLGVELSSKGILKLQIEYWNLGYTGRPWKIKEDEVRVHTSSFDFWHHLDYDILVEPRYVSGVPREALENQD
jgi:hypothetical protein